MLLENRLYWLDNFTILRCTISVDFGFYWNIYRIKCKLVVTSTSTPKRLLLCPHHSVFSRWCTTFPALQFISGSILHSVSTTAENIHKWTCRGVCRQDTETFQYCRQTNEWPDIDIADCLFADCSVPVLSYRGSCGATWTNPLCTYCDIWPLTVTQQLKLSSWNGNSKYCAESSCYEQHSCSSRA